LNNSDNVLRAVEPGQAKPQHTVMHKGILKHCAFLFGNNCTSWF